ncbi:hypothetical protein FQN60_005583 [Etheostoma spectabile]|uniref:Uncharacterized protein n=1 Tax=Etheostoma spectabile TaxID=54343 RepID=A0A5J5CEQ5_9PERO|nr:hypothetical protein FQN60_005583 [Etheostoma spectabile]
MMTGVCASCLQSLSGPGKPERRRADKPRRPEAAERRPRKPERRRADKPCRPEAAERR